MLMRMCLDVCACGSARLCSKSARLSKNDLLYLTSSGEAFESALSIQSSSGTTDGEFDLLVHGRSVIDKEKGAHEMEPAVDRGRSHNKTKLLHRRCIVVPSASSVGFILIALCCVCFVCSACASLKWLYLRLLCEYWRVDSQTFHFGALKKVRAMQQQHPHVCPHSMVATHDRVCCVFCVFSGC